MHPTRGVEMPKRLMNLKRMLRDASLTNLQWLLKGDTFNPADKDNDKKDDLEFQWGYGDIDPNYSSSTLIKVYDDEVNEGTQTRPVMDYAQELIMQGLMGYELLQALRKKFGKPVLRTAKVEVRKAVEVSGVLGCLAFQCDGGKKSTKQLTSSMKNSPFKRFMSYVMGCDACQKCRYLSSSCRSDSVMGNGADNSIDSFLDGEQDMVTAVKRFYCQKHMRPILGGEQDLSDEDMDSTLVDLETLGMIEEKTACKIRKRSGSNLSKLRSAFRCAYKRLRDKKKWAKDDSPKSDDYRIHSKMEIALQQQRIAQPEMSVDPVDHDSDLPLEVDEVSNSSSQEVVGVQSHVDEVELSDVDKRGLLEVEATDLDYDKPVQIAKKRKMKLQKVNGKAQPHVLVDKERRVMPDLEVDAADPAQDSPVDLASEKNIELQNVDALQVHVSDVKIGKRQKAKKQLNIGSLDAKVSDVDLSSADEMPDVIPASYDSGQEVDFAARDMGLIDMDALRANTEIDLNGVSQENLDIEASGYIGEEFRDTDRIALNKKKRYKREIDVNGASDFSF